MSIDDEINKLKAQQEKLELEKSKEAWAQWFKEGEDFLKSMVGKTFLIKHSRDLHLVKVTGFNKSNWLGNHSWKGWFEVNTEGYFTIRHANHIYGKGVDIPGGKDGTFGTFALRKRHNKTKLQHTSLLDYKSINMKDHCSIDTNRTTYCGYRGKNYSDDSYAFKVMPEHSVRHWLVGIWGWYEAPDGMYDECKALIDAIACETDKIWEKYEKIIPECKLIK